MVKIFTETSIEIMDEEILKSAEIIWNYHKMNHAIFKDDFAAKTDGILVFGSSDISVADEAANLWIKIAKDRLDANMICPYMIFSGGMGTGPHSGFNLMGWKRPEAEIFSERVESIVKKNENPKYYENLQVFIENKGENSGENVDLSKQIIDANNLKSEKLIIVQKPFMERRTYATFKHRWSDPDIRLYSSNISLVEYPDKSKISLEEVIGIMVGDLQRIKFYAPPHGNFQITQDIPEEVWQAFIFLSTDVNICKQYPAFTLNLIK